VRRYPFIPLFIFLAILANHGNAIQDGSTLSVYFENDLFANTDREYTNGTKFSLVSPDIDWAKEIQNGSSGALSPLSSLFVQILSPIAAGKDWLLDHSGLGWKEDPNSVSYNVEFIMGQQMYTPNDIQSKQLIPDERPYAGWLYTGMGLHRKTWRHLDVFEVNIGMVGPSSLAHETQDFVHSARGIAKAQGWDHQIKDELGIGVVLERKDRVLSWNRTGNLGADMITHYGASVGNVLTQMNAGFEIRLGWNLPQDFGESLLGRSGNTSSPNQEGELRWDQGFSSYLFTGIDGRMVLRNIFLDGNTFSGSHSVDKETWVGDWVIGTSAMIGKRLKLTYSQAIRTKEYEGQNDAQIFGSAYISWIF
jgi:hypothetical protein